MQASGQGEAALRVMGDEYASLSNKANGYALNVLLGMCFSYLQSGLLPQLQETAQLMLKQAQTGRLPIDLSWAHYMLGLVSYEWNDLDAAGRHFAEIVDNRYTAHVSALRDAMSGLALIQQLRGRRAEADSILKDLMAFDVQLSGQVDERSRAMRARIALMQGNNAEALHWALGFRDLPPDMALVWLEEPQVTRARILLAEAGPHLAQAFAVLDVLSDVAARTHNVRYAITLHTLRALALEAQKQHERAEQELQQALDLAQPDRFLRVFVDMGPRLQPILARLARSGAAATAERILAAFPAGDAPAAAATAGRAPAALRHPEMAEALTGRELQILRRLAEPLSIKEIAASLGISYLTVKRHLVNVYGKLGVRGRWDAVAQATALGILTPR